jgi:uncharacterized membrane-anchored protein YhcB (DUF1043 family)
MTQNIAIQSNASKIELHYFFSDESHTMDAVIRNKCEHEFLEIVKHVSTLFNVEFELESEAYAEGGLREWWSLTIKKNPTLAAIIIGVLINVLSNYITTDRELNDLQKQELRLSIEKLKQDLEENKEEPPYIHIENATFIINNDIKVQKHKSNFYKNLAGYHKVTKIETTALTKENKPTHEPVPVERPDFGKYILSSDEMPSEFDDVAVIEIVSPVLTNTNYKWKGIYKGESIDFSMKDKEFKESVISDKETFKNGTYIECVLEISRKVSDFGEVKNSGYSVLTVIKKDDGISQVITKQGKRYLDEQDAKERQLSLNFNDTE